MNSTIPTFIWLIPTLSILLAGGILLLGKRLQRQHTQALHNAVNQCLEMLQQQQQQARTAFDQHQLSSLNVLQDSLQKSAVHTQQQVGLTLNNHAQQLSQQFDTLTRTVDERLVSISQQVEKRVTEGFEKTTNLFNEMVKRLALIDEAQKKITELSGNVVRLQTLFSNRSARGAFGEVQLTQLIRNIMPSTHFQTQYTLSNAKRVDCMLFLPQPTGNLAIDAKFPLESFQRLTQADASESDQKSAAQQFRIDIKKHITDIATKYIIPNETAESAVMFLPAEAVFAEIHARYPDLVALAHQQKVWMVSPTTMMAILTTASAVLKDVATQKQAHLIQEHLKMLAKDFDRFQIRIQQLARHIEQAHTDIGHVHKSSQKIARRFQKIEQVECTDTPAMLEEAD